MLLLLWIYLLLGEMGSGASDFATVSSDGTLILHKEKISRVDASKMSEISYILSHHADVNDDWNKKTFSQDTLIYITPWNKRGYHLTSRYPALFSMISPVWFQLRFDGSVRVTGDQDINGDWLESVRNCSSNCPLIVPRVIVECDPTVPGLVKAIVELLERNKYDGIVLEGTESKSLFQFLSSEFRRMKRPHVGTLKEVSHHSPILVRVLRPAYYIKSTRYGGMKPLEYNEWSEFVDYFSLMTYDYSRPFGKGGPNSPLLFCEQNLHLLVNGTKDEAVDVLERLGPLGNDSPISKRVRAGKILMGLPFYGYHEQEAIVAHQFLETLERSGTSLVWDELSGEHIVQNKDIKGYYTYPTPLFIWLRLRLAERFGAGISIWEGGQGLDYFAQLL